MKHGSRMMFQQTYRELPERVGPMSALITSGDRRYSFHRVQPERWVAVRAYEVAA